MPDQKYRAFYWFIDIFDVAINMSGFMIKMMMMMMMNDSSFNKQFAREVGRI